MHVPHSLVPIGDGDLAGPGRHGSPLGLHIKFKHTARLLAVVV